MKGRMGFEFAGQFEKSEDQIAISLISDKLDYSASVTINEAVLYKEQPRQMLKW